MNFSYPVTLTLFFIAAIILNGFSNALAQTTGNHQNVQNGASATPITLQSGGCIYNWTNNTPGIGLPASGTGNIPSFTAVNNSNLPITATINATPIAAGFAYIANSGSNDITVINTVTHSTVTTIPVGIEPWSVAVNHTGTLLYIANASQTSTTLNAVGTVSVISTATNSVIASIQVGETPIELVVSPDDSKVYVANESNGIISVINTATNTVTSTFFISTPLGMAISPDGKWLYVTSNDQQSLLNIINTTTNTVAATVPVGTYSVGLIVSPDGSRLYLTNNAANTVTAVNTTTNSIISTIAVGGSPYGITISPDGSKLYVANSSSKSVSVINTATNTVMATTATSGYPFGISASPDGSEVYVAQQSPDGISVINTSNNAVETTINSGSSPISLGNFFSGSPGCSTVPITATITVNSNSAPTVQPPNFTYPSPDVYTINTPITPIGPTTLGGPVPATIFGKVSTFAGHDTQGGYLDATGNAALFTSLWGIDIDASGNLYVADGPRIRKITPGALVTTLAGGNPNGLSDGIGTAAGFGQTAGLTVTPSGIIIVGDIPNKSLRQVTPAGAVTTFAGAGINNFDPAGVTSNLAGDIFVADQGAHIIRDFANGGPATIYAGTQGIAGSTNGPIIFSLYNKPTDLKFDKAGNLFIADQNNNMIREISAGGIVTTVAGSLTPGLVGGPIASALFNRPVAIALDGPNNIYVSDWRGIVIRMIDANGFVVSVAGDNARNISADGIGALANFKQVSGLVYSNGVLYAADKTCVREITVTGYSIDKPLPSGLIFDSKTGTISGTPNVVTPTTQYTIIGYNTGGSYVTTISITVDPPKPPKITYPTPEVYKRNIAITPLVPSNSGGAVSSTGASNGYTVDKPLPPGLILDPTTGVISGTPSVISSQTDYTITAHNEGGTNQFTITITVYAPRLTNEVITFNPIPTKTYGDPDFDPGATSNNNGVPIVYTSEVPTVATIVNGQIHIIGVGTTNIKALQAGDNNYDAAFPVLQPFTVKQFPLTITVDDQTRFFGEPNPVFTFSYSPFVYNEDASYLTTQPTATTIATQTSAPGQYVINISGATSNNYKITQLPGTLTIKQTLPTVVVPNAFTPNGDGINDLWNIKSIEAYPKCLVSIYSRYGGLVYQSRGYARSWDGTSNGTPLPTGTYYYIINLNEGDSLPLTGYVAVIR